MKTLHCGKIKKLKVFGRIGYVGIEDSKNIQYEHENTYNFIPTRNVQYSSSYMSIYDLYGSKIKKTGYLIRKFQANQLSNSFIMTGYGGIKLLRMKKDIFKTTILTGLKYFGETESETECGINKIIVGESIEQTGIFPGLTGYDSEKS